MDWTKAFATTETTKLYLDEERQFWIEVRNELGHAEQNSIALAGIRGISRTGEPAANRLVELDVSLDTSAERKVFIYLVDWNLVDGKGKTIDISTEPKKRDALRNMDEAHYQVIEALIDAHVLAQLEQKKTQPGETK